MQGSSGAYALDAESVRVLLDRPWEGRGPADAIIRRWKSAQGRMGWSFARRHAKFVIPRLKAAGFEDVANRMEKEIGESVVSDDTLPSLSTAREPEDVTDALGKAICEDTTAILKKRLPAGVKPHPYQIVGTAFARANGYRTLIADDMGLGKTVQAICGLVADPEKLLPVVIICPSIVFLNWQRELSRWAPGLMVYRMPRRDSPAPPKGFRGVILTKTPLLHYQRPALQKFGPLALIVDEAQDYKNSRSLQSKALTNLAKSVERVILLSGTPFKNNLLELRNLLSLLDPSFADPVAFGEKYTEASDKETPNGKVRVYEGMRNVDDLRDRLTQWMIRRTKAQVAEWLPPKSHRYLPLDPEGPRLEEYQKAEAEFEAWLRSEFEAGLKREFASRPGLTRSEREAMRGEVEERVLRALAAESLTKIGYLRQLVGRMKIRAAVAYLVTAVDNGVPVLAFGWYQQVVKGVVAGLKKNGVRVGLVDGGMSSEEKQKVNDAFEAGQLDVVVGSKALAVGASYPRAQEVLFIERFWTPADEMQAEDRAHRATTKHPVVVSFLHLNGTVDERVRAIVDRKRHLVSAVLGGADVSFDATGVREVLSDYLGTRPFEPEEDTPTRVAPVAPSKPSVSKADVVALSFARKDWTPRNAVEWAKISGWRPDRIREVRGRLILDVGKAKRGVAYRAVKLGSGVTAIVPRR